MNESQTGGQLLTWKSYEELRRFDGLLDQKSDRLPNVWSSESRGETGNSGLEFCASNRRARAAPFAVIATGNPEALRCLPENQNFSGLYTPPCSHYAVAASRNSHIVLGRPRKGCAWSSWPFRFESNMTVLSSIKFTALQDRELVSRMDHSLQRPVLPGTTPAHVTHLSVCNFAQHELPRQPLLSPFSMSLYLPCKNATMPRTARNACPPV